MGKETDFAGGEPAAWAAAGHGREVQDSHQSNRGAGLLLPASSPAQQVTLMPDRFVEIRQGKEDLEC